MAAFTTDGKKFQDQESNNNSIKNEVSRQEIQAAIAKAVELRALHAALLQGSSPANLRFPSSSPASRPASQFSAQDYPVFTPSYEDEPLPGYHHVPTMNRTLSESWDEYGLEEGNGDEAVLSSYKDNSSSRKGFPSDLANFESHACPAEDHKSVTGSCTNQITVLQTSPANEFYRSSRRNSLGDFNSLSSCNRCKPAIITSESENGMRNCRNSNTVVPLTDSHSSVQSQPKSRGVISWLFPRLRKKHRNESSPNRTESEEVSQVYRDLGIMSIETLKRELIQANENRDAALMEVSEMKSSVGELKQKLDYLETYCEELKRALRQATHAKSCQTPEKLGNFPKRGKSNDGNAENLMPVSEEVMVEGFLQIVSEARLSVKQFCKILVAQIEVTDNTLVDNLNMLLQPFKLSLSSKYSKAVLYHLEAIINQSLYQDFENCVFQKNGSPKLLDPQQARQAQFSSFVALRNLSWNEVLRKGTKYYCEEFSKFCDQKMSCIITTLNWTRPWPEQVLQAFFVATKCIWLLHLLAFSFNPPLGILRVEENRSFDPHYMEDMFIDRQRSHGSSRVKIMVMPGFYVQDNVLRCKVLCRYKSAGSIS
ncbi:IRK-interacting protein [Prunus yedoensis var. nudiflora]|uniref:IRK-interacting protein n=1 Tax=Prunus yedoensis var. nudiflora TaxID=2094558 RepID=A0A314Y3D4_PRUYE|nr:IRK-interacting protein [Prunus yedoensis var. nudiflora]